MILEFYYHLFGSDIFRLRLDVDTGSVNPDWHIGYKILNGQVQNSSSENWQKEQVNLSPFIGKVVQFRFVAIKDGTGDLADYAIDDISIKQGEPYDAGLDVNSKLVVSTQCSYGTAEPLSVIVKNFGTNVLSEVPLAYQLNNTAIVRDTAVINLNFHDTATHLFNTPLNLSGLGYYSIKVWTELPNDSINSNDTLKIAFTHAPAINSFPYLLNFESATPAPDLTSGNGQINNTAIALNEVINSSNGARWMIYNKAVEELNMGPLGGVGRRGNYLLYRDPSGSATQDKAEMLLKCVDFSSLSNPQLSLRYFILNQQVFTLLVREKDGGNWHTVGAIAPNASNKKSEYGYKVFDLSAYAGKSVEIKLRGESNHFQGQLGAIDDIAIYDKVTTDFALASISPSYYGGLLSALPSSMDFTILNTGSSVGPGNIVLKGEFNEICGSNIFGFQTAPIQSSFIQSTFNRTLTYSGNVAAGNYLLKMWLESPIDTINHFHDTLYREVSLIAPVSLPYFNDFEDCSKPLLMDGEYMEWEVAAPQKGGNLNSAYSGSSALTLSPDSRMGSQSEIVMFPHFKGLDTIYGAELSLRNNFELGTATGKIQYYKGGSWQSFPVSASASNWTFHFNNGFTGSSQGWIKSTYPLNDLGRISLLALRVEADNVPASAPGWLIDDVEISFPVQNSAAPVNILFNHSPVAGQNSAKVEIKNTGAAPLKEVQLDLKVNGMPVHTQSYAFSALMPGDKRVLNLSASFFLNPAQNNDLTIITSAPNKRKDLKPADDSLSLVLYVPDSINPLPWCTDFENSQQFLQFNYNQMSVDRHWKYGFSNKTILNGAHSGLKAWFTYDMYYPELADNFLVSPPFEVNGGECYELSFWHQYDTEFNFDGGTVEYSLNDGQTWQVFGSEQDSMWYNTPAIQSLSAYKPGWSGSSGGWIESSKIVHFHDTATVQFRFRFASNSNDQREGWVIDDFCLQSYAGSCDAIGINEWGTALEELQLFPNPASHSIFILSSFSIEAEDQLTISDVNGKRVHNIEGGIDPYQRREIDISMLSPGMYFLQFSGRDGRIHRQKFLVQP